MNVASSQAASGEALQGLLNARDPAASEAPAAPAPSDAGYASGVRAYLQPGSPASHAELQTAASYAQAASGYVGRLSELLQQMAGLSSRARSGTADVRDGAASGFEAAQEELRSIVGGTPGEIGGSGSPGAVFGGSDMFGPSSGSATVATGLATQPSVTLGANELNLRQGAILRLLGQDASGSFELGASDPRVPQAISDAVHQVSSATGAVDRTQAMVGIASAEVPVGEENLASAVVTPPDAAKASASAARAIMGLRGTAVAAFSGLAPQPFVGLLQGA